MTITDPHFFVTGGTLQYNAPSYVVRKADTDLLEGLRQGDFCYVLNSRQMGKSSLMVRAAQTLKEQGVRVAVLDLTAIGQNLAPEQWYDGLLNRLGRQLDCEEELEAFWDQREKLGPMQRWMEAIRQVVLPSVSSSLVIFVDEIDFVRSLPFSADEFFAGIRECYTRRAQDPLYRRLTFCLLGVAMPADLIRDPRTTPFNIGIRIELRDFTAQEAAPLAEGLVHHQDTKTQREDDRITDALSSAFVVSEGHVAVGSTAKEFIPSPLSKVESRKLLDRILYWTGGHPYLTQQLCKAVAETAAHDKLPNIADVNRLCADLFLSPRSRANDTNLMFVRDRLLKSEADLTTLLELYRQIRFGKPVPDEEANPLVSLLRLSGIARVENGSLRVRNRIYETLFDHVWIVQNMPNGELQRRKSAYRQGLAQAFLISNAFILLPILAQAHLNPKAATLTIVLSYSLLWLIVALFIMPIERGGILLSGRLILSSLATYVGANSLLLLFFSFNRLMEAPEAALNLSLPDTNQLLLLLTFSLIPALSTLLPAYLILYRKLRVRQPATYLFAGAICGLILACAKGTIYTTYAAISSHDSAETSYFSIDSTHATIDVIGFPLEFALSFAVAGYFFGRIVNSSLSSVFQGISVLSILLLSTVLIYGVSGGKPSAICLLIELILLGWCIKRGDA